MGYHLLHPWVALALIRTIFNASTTSISWVMSIYAEKEQ